MLIFVDPIVALQLYVCKALFLNWTARWWLAGKQDGSHTYILGGRHRQAGTQTDWKTGGQVDRQTWGEKRMAGRQPGIQAGRLINLRFTPQWLWKLKLKLYKRLKRHYMGTLRVSKVTGVVCVYSCYCVCCDFLKVGEVLLTSCR